MWLRPEQGFTPAWFVEHGKRAGYEIADSRYFSGNTFLPRRLYRFVLPFMETTDTGMQFQIWLRRKTVLN
ncbi:MAG TPA: hypothetical protein VHV75_00490 [Solirubrobacteraceae bacterium]|nr:hypothetical protein [Solirubrobacteraceae bacterium]